MYTTVFPPQRPDAVPVPLVLGPAPFVVVAVIMVPTAPFAMFLPIPPFPIIAEFGRLELTRPVDLPVHPAPLIHVPVGVPRSSLPRNFVPVPLAIIRTTIRVRIHAGPVALAVLPVARVLLPVAINNTSFAVELALGRDGAVVLHRRRRRVGGDYCCHADCFVVCLLRRRSAARERPSTRLRVRLGQHSNLLPGARFCTAEGSKFEHSSK